MGEVEKGVTGKNKTGAYTEYTIYGNRDKIRVQSEEIRGNPVLKKGKYWGIYRISPGVKKMERIWTSATRKIGETYAMSYIHQVM